MAFCTPMVQTTQWLTWPFFHTYVAESTMVDMAIFYTAAWVRMVQQLTVPAHLWCKEHNRSNTQYTNRVYKYRGTKLVYTQTLTTALHGDTTYCQTTGDTNIVKMGDNRGGWGINSLSRAPTVVSNHKLSTCYCACVGYS